MSFPGARGIPEEVEILIRHNRFCRWDQKGLHMIKNGPEVVRAIFELQLFEKGTPL
jgi:hypothetical protein